MDGCFVKAPLSCIEEGAARLERRKQGSRWAAIVERGGLILAVVIESGDRHDLPPGRAALASLHVPETAQPGVFAAEGAFDDRAFRVGLEALGFTPDIPRNPRQTGAPKSRGFVPGRWVVERTPAHLGAFRAIRIRWSRRLASFTAFLALATAHYLVRAVELWLLALGNAGLDWGTAG